MTREYDLSVADCNIIAHVCDYLSRHTKETPSCSYQKPSYWVGYFLGRTEGKGFNDPIIVDLGSENHQLIVEALEYYVENHESNEFYDKAKGLLNWFKEVQNV